jgi:1-deoxy-D-xylulose-5-phosphate reductoisomerase
LKVCILGSTGSIGRQALDVIEQHPDRLQAVALGAYSSRALLDQQAHKHHSAYTALVAEDGDQALLDLIEQSEPDIVLNALVGAAGLRATVATLKAGIRLALANKESLVIGGDLVMPLAAPGQLLPVDSEHSAIYQCLLGESVHEMSRIWLTASGGPFRGLSRAELQNKTAADALAHPTWNMGPKISIDSATLMNKGLEVIEAHHLFNAAYQDITVLVQPQSAIHSMVEFKDGTVKAHLGAADMRVPIQFAFSYPERWTAPAPPVDFRTLTAGLSFGAPDTDTFGCLKLAFEAGKTGGTAPTVLNAANEIAVAAFLNGDCSFLEIEAAVRDALTHFTPNFEPVTSLEQIEELDTRTRAYVSYYPSFRT